jgi:malonate transporter and related proteins
MAVVSAIIPVFLIILCGYLCRQFKFPDANFWRGAEKITYFLLFPALLFSKMASADLTKIDFFKPIIVIMLMYLVVTALQLAVKPWVKIGNAQFTSVYQGSIRFNTYIGLALASALYGAEGLVAAVVMTSVMIPTLNVLCVMMLEFYNEQHAGNTSRRVVKSIIRNPLIIACAAGMGINFAGISLPAVLMEALNVFARAALPLGLLTVGAALALDAIKSALKPLLLASMAKFIVLPSVAMGLCYWLDIDSMVRNAILIFTALPTAPASYVLARQLGGDYHLMATIITVQTLLAVMLMPLILVTLG